MKTKVKMFCLVLPVYQHRQSTKEMVVENFIPLRGSGEIVGVSGEEGSNRTEKIIFVIFSRLNSPVTKDIIT